MARTTLPLTVLNANTSQVNLVGTAVDQANGMVVTITTTGVPAIGSGERLLFYVTNTFAGVNTVTIRKGSNPAYLNVPAFRASKGDLVTANLTASTGTAWIGPLDPSWFEQPDVTSPPVGSPQFFIDFSATMTGVIFAFLLQRAF